MPPGAHKRAEMLGSFKNECAATRKALNNIQNYWEPLRMPKCGDWLDTYNEECLGYDQFAVGKFASPTRKVIYIQPLVYQDNAVITEFHLQYL